MVRLNSYAKEYEIGTGERKKKFKKNETIENQSPEKKPKDTGLEA